MAVTISERPDSTDTVDARLIRNVSRNWDMHSTTRMSSVAASLAFSVDQNIYINTLHPDLSTLYCSTISVTEDVYSSEPFHHYSVSASYTNNFDSGGEGTSGGGGSAGGATGGQQQGTPPNERVENPVLRPVDIKVSGQTMQVSLRQDANGKPYINTAGDPISPAPTRAVPTVKITVGRNYLICPGNMFQHIGKINNAALTIPIANLSYPAYGLKFATLDAEPVNEGGIRYWRVTYTLEQGPNRNYQTGLYKGWITPAVSIGRRGKTNLNPSVHVITDGETGLGQETSSTGTGQPMAEPVFLNNNGYFVKIDATGSNIFYMDFQPDESFNMMELFS